MTRSARGKTTRHSGLSCAGLLLLSSLLLPGCATQLGADAAGREDFAAIPVSAPRAPEGRAGRGIGLRRAAGASQAAILYARSVHVDPVSRPVSNATSLASLVLKSTVGLLRRFGLRAVRRLSLRGTPVPPVAPGNGMDLVQWERDLDKIVGHSSSMATIDFLVDGEEYFTRLLEAFRGAGESIDIRTYIFDNDDYAVEVANALKDRSQDVRVRVQIDALGNLLAMQADPASLPEGYVAPFRSPNTCAMAPPSRSGIAPTRTCTWATTPRPRSSTAPRRSSAA